MLSFQGEGRYSTFISRFPCSRCNAGRFKLRSLWNKGPCSPYQMLPLNEPHTYYGKLTRIPPKFQKLRRWSQQLLAKEDNPPTPCWSKFITLQWKKSPHNFIWKTVWTTRRQKEKKPNKKNVYNNLWNEVRMDFRTGSFPCPSYFICFDLSLCAVLLSCSYIGNFPYPLLWDLSNTILVCVVNHES